MNFTLKSLGDSGKQVKKMFEFEKRLLEATGGDAEDVDLSHPILEKFGAALADDLNVAGALAVVNPWISSNPEKTNPKEALGVWRKINSVLGIEDSGSESDDSDGLTLEQAEELCKEMNAAKAAKEYERSDAIRKELLDAGYKVNQSEEGATIQKQLV